LREGGFEGTCVVRRRSTLLRWSTAVMMAAGFFGLVGSFWTSSSMGVVLGSLVLLVASLVANVQGRSSALLGRRKRAVGVRSDGVYVDGVLAIPREKLASGFFQPGQAVGVIRPRMSAVCLLNANGQVVVELELDERRSHEVLRVLGLDVEHQRVEFVGSSPPYAFLLRGRPFLFGIGALLMVSVGFYGPLLLLPLLALGVAPALVGSIAPARITVGIDGIFVRWLWHRRFIPLAGVVRAEPVGDDAILLARSSSEGQVLYTSVATHRGVYGPRHRDAVLRRVREVLEVRSVEAPSTGVMSLLARGGRTKVQWLEGVAAMGQGGSYRGSVVPEEDLWTVLHDASAPEDARAAAAMALRASLDDAGRARVRVAADAVASPRLRVALESAVADDVERLASAMADLGAASRARSK